MAVTYGVGKVTAISVAQKGLKLDTLGKVDCDMTQVYGRMLWYQAEV